MPETILISEALANVGLLVAGNSEGQVLVDLNTGTTFDADIDEFGIVIPSLNIDANLYEYADASALAESVRKAIRGRKPAYR